MTYKTDHLHTFDGDVARQADAEARQAKTRERRLIWRLVSLLLMTAGTFALLPMPLGWGAIVIQGGAAAILWYGAYHAWTMV